MPTVDRCKDGDHYIRYNIKLSSRGKQMYIYPSCTAHICSQASFTSAGLSLFVHRNLEAVFSTGNTTCWLVGTSGVSHSLTDMFLQLLKSYSALFELYCSKLLRLSTGYWSMPNLCVGLSHK